MKLIFPSLFILISILTFIFGVNKLYGEVSTLKSEIGVYNEALNNSTNLQTTEDTLATSYSEIPATDKDRLNKFLPSSVNNIQFILEVERIANLNHMQVKDVKFETMKKDTTPKDPNIIVAEVPTETKPYGVFPMSFTTDGTYDQFISFLKDLEFNLRLIDVKSISFTIPDTTGKPVAGVDPNSYHYTVNVETYWLK